jgi:hypothetical protein
MPWTISAFDAESLPALLAAPSSRPHIGSKSSFRGAAVKEREIPDMVAAAMNSLYGADAWPPLPLDQSEVRRVRLAVASILFGVQFASGDELGDYLDAARGDDYETHDLSHTNHLTALMMHVAGYGADLVHVSSTAGIGFDPLSTPTLADHDKAFFDYAQQTLASLGASVDAKPYRGFLYGFNCRWREEGVLVYGSLSIASQSAYSVLEDLLMECADKRFPSDPERNLREMLASPTPQEELKSRFLTNGMTMASTLLEEEPFASLFDGGAPWASVETDRTRGEVRKTIVFANADAISEIRFSDFVADIGALPDGSEIYARKTQMVAAEFLKRITTLANAMEMGDGRTS